MSKKGSLYVYPEYAVKPGIKDLMIRGGKFYAIYTGERWSTCEADAAVLIDNMIREKVESLKNDCESCIGLYLSNFSTKEWLNWRTYTSSLPDNYHKLNSTVLFANDDAKKEDYATFKLPYDIAEGDMSCYDELMSTLYLPEERQKIEWAIGSVICGESKSLQKFIVLYGDAGTGKSTVLNIIQQMFEYKVGHTLIGSYWAPFNASELVTKSNSFALEQFKNDPIISIQHDGDLSHIEDNTILNSIVSHETMTVNEKFKAKYSSRFETMLFLASNSPVKITNTKSGILRRLIDVYPTGNKLPAKEYNRLFKGIHSEMGAIAYHCKSVFEELGKNYYDGYKPRTMFEETNDFFNFMDEMKHIFKDGVTLKSAWAAYKEYVDDAKVQFPFSKRIFKNELKGYFLYYYPQKRLDNGENATNYYEGLIWSKFDNFSPPENKADEFVIPDWLKFNSVVSCFNDICSDCKAQIANERGTPTNKWSEVTSTLKDIDIAKVHYVILPQNHIVIDFDCRNSAGDKDILECIKAIVKYGFKKTYAEPSKSGNGIHLHYIYDGDVTQLSSVYAPNVEIKVYLDDKLTALRRKFIACNGQQIAHISGGLPLKGDGKKMVDKFTLANDKQLHNMIIKNLNKEYHASTKSSIDYIKYLLDEAWRSGISYDVRDLEPYIIAFALNSTHQSAYCSKVVDAMQLCSEDRLNVDIYHTMQEHSNVPNDEPLTFYDLEVYPNVFFCCWKNEGESVVHRWIQPSKVDVENLLNKKLVGYNNRKYDNHILYAWLMGYGNKELYELSRLIIDGHKPPFGEAYNISYADVYDFCSIKQSLKKWEIDLNIFHKESEFPWDEPLPESAWPEVADYCANDVIATEAVFHERKADYMARLILSDLSGLSPNDTTRMHVTKFIFGNEKKPKLNYTDLSDMFPGYEYKDGHSFYRGEDPKEGGYVYAEPGVYRNIALLDIASMHPTSIEQLNLFGEYTKRFSEIKQARIFIKHKDYESAKKLLDGKLVPYLNDDKDAKELSHALKIIINSVYGYTSAKFINPFRDERNVDNIVAKRGALFMINLKHEVQDRGFTVAHIKTDSIKIPNATPEIIEFVMDYGIQYGYIFEHEDTYEKMCLVNDAVYVAKSMDGHWSAVGAQFQVPYVFKTLFSKEAITFDDMCETKSVTTSMVLDFNEELKEGEHDYTFVGRVGRFTPVKTGFGGGELLRKNNNGGYAAVVGTKGYRWKESYLVKDSQDSIDISYYRKLVDDAKDAITKYLSDAKMTIEEFIN